LKNKRKGRSVQQLLGIQTFTKYGLLTDNGELLFYRVAPMDTNEKLRNAMLFNILSYMSNALIGIGNTVAAIDELYLFLSNLTTIEYIRNSMNRSGAAR